MLWNRNSFAAVGMLAALMISGVVPRLARRRALEAETAAVTTTVSTVRVATVTRSPGASSLTLPGTVEPIHEAAIYARASGYVRRSLVDIGSRVRVGQLLATIESPEVEQEYHQAEATLRQSQATETLAVTTAERWRKLAADSVVTRQELDEREGTANAARAATAAARANARRLAELRRFQQVTAPFAGVITARGVDVGALVNANAGNGGQRLFQLVQIDTVRVYLRVPQAYAAQVHPGTAATVRLEELPDRKFPARVTRTANALDVASRTLLVEVQAVNRDGALLPGMYAAVDLSLEGGSEPVSVPATALIVGGEGTRVATVDSAGRVRLVGVQVGRDYGDRLDIRAGLEPGDRVVLNPGDELRAGQPVRVQEAESRREP